MHLRFLEFVDSPVLHKRYASLTAPLRSSAEVQRRLPRTPEVIHLTRTCDALIRRLEEVQHK